MVEELLETTRGDLDTANRLNRFAEFSTTRQIRVANNRRTMWDFAAGWDNEHDLAQPLIAAFFDAFVGIYKAILVRHGAIPRALDDLAEMAERDPAWRGRARAGFARAYARHPGRFHDALAEARDIAATMLIGLWSRADPTTFRLGDIPRDPRARSTSRQFGGAPAPDRRRRLRPPRHRPRAARPPAAAARAPTATCIRSGQRAEDECRHCASLPA